ncbi:MAG: class I SAM-dependent methyltransferase [Alphaproteobacteria bacterium]|nr:class I SAM-dependent methyltransferase [Alphaproteobacteria bacterium]MCB9791193.1 class I SAM-dependent methyltransferase [Alphaproteobacteria bacterium]
MSEPKPNLRVLRHYERIDEAGRLTRPVGALEWARTWAVLERHLPPTPARVLDIGGGPGRYAQELTRRGHEVHLLDLSAKHVAQALAGEHPPASARVGDARRLPFPDDHADLTLLLGPLYHLLHAAERAQAWSEAARVTRPGGLVIAAAISRYASALDGLLREVDDPVFEGIVDEDLRSGQHRDPSESERYFTDAFFHDPDALAQEMADAGLRPEGVLAVEGPGGLLPDLHARLADPRRRALLLGSLARLESIPAVRGTSFHLLALGRCSI